MKFIYIFRHGQTEYNRKGILQGRTIDAPLNEIGWDQVNAFHDYYKEIDFDLVISSELIRSKQSVDKFLDNGVDYQVDERVTEFSWGDNEGLPLDEIIIHNYKKMLNAWYDGKLDTRIPGGESGSELQARIHDFVNYLSQVDAENILICTHGRTLKMLIVSLLDMDIDQMEKIRHSNTALFLIHEHDGKFEMLLNNDTRHLPDELDQNAFWDK